METTVDRGGYPPTLRPSSRFGFPRGPQPFSISTYRQSHCEVLDDVSKMPLLTDLIGFPNAVHETFIELVVAVKAELMDMIASGTLDPIKKRLFPAPT